MATPLPDIALDQLFRTARSFNAFLPGEVGEDTVQTIWDLMKMGPTSTNQMPARLTWCTTAESKERLARHAGERNRSKITGAPVCVILAMDIDFHEQLPWLFPHTDARSWFAGSEPARAVSAMRNASLQGAYLILAARALGLDCAPMSGFDNAAVDADFFGDTPSWRSNFICSIGRGDPASIFERSPRPDFATFNRIL